MMKPVIPTNELEKALCLMYQRSREVQHMDVDYSNKKESSRLRVKNLNRQYRPYDMVALCRKHGVTLRGDNRE
jgi:hypothetical protein